MLVLFDRVRSPNIYLLERNFVVETSGRRRQLGGSGRIFLCASGWLKALLGRYNVLRETTHAGACAAAVVFDSQIEVHLNVSPAVCLSFRDQRFQSGDVYIDAAGKLRIVVAFALSI